MTKGRSTTQIAFLASSSLIAGLAFVVALAGDWLFPPDTGDDEIAAEHRDLARPPSIEDRIAVVAANLTPSLEDIESAESELDPLEEPPGDALPPRQLEAKGGPLRDAGWRFKWSSINRDLPDQSFVLLERKRTTARGGTTTDRFSFWIRDTHIIDESLDLDFVVLSVDAQKVLYFAPDRPDIVYHLERETTPFFRVHDGGAGADGER